MEFGWHGRGGEGENFAKEGLKWCYRGCSLGLGCTLYELSLCSRLYWHNGSSIRGHGQKLRCPMNLDYGLNKLSQSNI